MLFSNQFLIASFEKGSKYWRRL